MVDYKNMNSFQYKEDEDFFRDLLGEYYDEKFFDFSDPSLKRKKFNFIRKEMLTKLLTKYGKRCFLSYECCDLKSGFNIDHIIPLSTNKLNKELRNIKAEKGKKVLSQPFGSNNEINLILTCRNCNFKKKHRILSKAEIRKILNSIS